MAQHGGLIRSAQIREGRAFVGHRFGKGLLGAQTAADNGINKAQRKGFGGPDRAAGGDKFNCGFHPGKAGRADGTGGSGHDAKGDFGQTDRGGVGHHPEAAAHRDLRSPAEGRAVDGGHPRFGRLFQPVHEAGKCGGVVSFPNSVTSAPAMKVQPSQLSTTARTDEPASSMPTASHRPWRRTWPSALTGGLLTVTTAISPSCWMLTVILNPWIRFAETSGMGPGLIWVMAKPMRAGATVGARNLTWC